MRCPNCGAEMPVGFLYCEQCGEDIHIVPDFEPEVELNIEQTISEIAEDIKGEQNTYGQTVKTPKDRKRGLIMGVVSFVFAFIIIVVTLIYQHNSFDYQTDMAKWYVEMEQYDKSIECYQRALELSNDDVTIMFALAEVYFLKNNKVEYEYLLRQIVKNESATSEQMESAYGKLIAIYRAREDFKSINELLLASKNEKIIYTYQNYVAMKPEFSVQEGFYTDIQPLKLTAYGTGKIYYTLDGSEPNENSTQYTAPIVLDHGKHTICAYFVNEFGIASEYVTKTYHVEIEALPAPDLSALSGEYEFPINIEVLDDDTEIYYTMDGKTPTLSSTPYTGPIPMPLGKSTFKFVRIEGARTSDVVERTYTLEMNTEYTPQDAEEDVVEYSLQSGKIYDKKGYGYDTFQYKYEYQYVRNINEVDDFYVISELIFGEDGSLTKTGNHFAVNAYNGEIYKLQIDEYNNYTLVEIEGQSEMND